MVNQNGRLPVTRAHSILILTGGPGYEQETDNGAVITATNIRDYHPYQLDHKYW